MSASVNGLLRMAAALVARSPDQAGWRSLHGTSSAAPGSRPRKPDAHGRPNPTRPASTSAKARIRTAITIAGSSRSPRVREHLPRAVDARRRHRSDRRRHPAATTCCAVSYFGGTPAVVVYKIDAEKLVGEWTMGGTEGTTYAETLTRVPGRHTCRSRSQPADVRRRAPSRSRTASRSRSLRGSWIVCVV